MKVESKNKTVSIERAEELLDRCDDVCSIRDRLDDLVRQDRTIEAEALDQKILDVLGILHLRDRDELPGDKQYTWHRAMFHELTPGAYVAARADARARATTEARGKVQAEKWAHDKEEEYAKAGLCGEVVTAISEAQTQRLDGAMILSLYSEYVELFCKRAFSVDEKLAALGEQAERGSTVGDVTKDAESEPMKKLKELLGDGRPFVVSFNYGSHQTYMRMSRDGNGFQLTYFDRQRQDLTLRGKNVPGYFRNRLDGTGVAAQPIRFTFDMTADALTALCARAKEPVGKVAGRSSVDERAEVLPILAAGASRVDLVGAPQPAQHGDAINCPWASLASVIRLDLGQESLSRQVTFMREVTATMYIAEHGTPAEKAALAAAQRTDPAESL